MSCTGFTVMGPVHNHSIKVLVEMSKSDKQFNAVEK